MIFRVAPQPAGAAEHQERSVRCMTDAMDSEEDGPDLAVDTETAEAILVNRANSQLVQAS